MTRPFPTEGPFVCKKIMTNLSVQHGLPPTKLADILLAKQQRLLPERQAIRLFLSLLKRAPFKSKSHLQDHSLRMLSNLRFLKPKFNHLDLLKMAIVLHDIGVFYSQEPCHGAESARRIRSYIEELGLSKQEQEQQIQQMNRLCSMVRAHDDPGFVDNSLEARALRALDSLDAFGHVGAYRYLEIDYRRGLQSPAIYQRALKSMIMRREKLETQLFEPRDLASIHQSFEQGFNLVKELIDNKDNAEILAGLMMIEWNLGRISELPFKDFSSKITKDFFFSLHQSLPAPHHS